MKPIFLFPASDLPLTTGNILALLTQPICDGLEGLFGVPFAYKLLLEDDRGIEILKKFKLCLYGGSPMPDELGDKLVSEGVRLAGHIGSTEMGQVSRMHLFLCKQSGRWPPIFADFSSSLHPLAHDVLPRL